MGGGRRSDIKGDFAVSLSVVWSEVRENREFMDKSKCKSAENRLLLFLKQRRQGCFYLG